jgi:hypothetical protein
MLICRRKFSRSFIFNVFDDRSRISTGTVHETCQSYIHRIHIESTMCDEYRRRNRCSFVGIAIDSIMVTVESLPYVFSSVLPLLTKKRQRTRLLFAFVGIETEQSSNDDKKSEFKVCVMHSCLLFFLSTIFFVYFFFFFLLLLSSHLL